MDTSTARVHPQQLMIAKLRAQGRVQDAHGIGDECPATLAYFCGGATCAHAVVVGHVDIEYQLTLQWGEELPRLYRPCQFALAWLSSHHYIRQAKQWTNSPEMSTWARSQSA